jgi:Ca-activated chloride channel homolog
MKTTGFIFSLVILFSVLSYSQSTRDLVNGGVDKYKSKKFVDSEIDFRKGIEKTPDNFAANFNLGDSYYKQQRFDDAIGSYKTALNLASSKSEKAKVYHNIGNSLLKSKKYQESVDAYKKALKLNPDDEDTKYNLSYALNMLNQKQNQQNQNNKNNQNDKNNQNNQNNQNQQNQDNKDNKDKNKQNQDKNQQNKDNKQDQQNKQNQQDQQNPKNQESKQDNLKQQQQKMSKDEAERILQALKNNEQDLQKKLRKQKGVPVKTDKDW